jgi:hypothetical protein
MDTAQVLLVTVVVILTLLLVILGIQVLLILKELKETIMKINKVLDDAGIISESVSTPIASMSSILSGVKTGMSILTLFKKKKKAKNSTEEESNA